MRPLAAVLALAAALLAAVTTADATTGAEATRLFASVDANARIILADASGNRVTQLDPGTYEIVVRDTTDEHNFHLTGPGVNRTTSVSGTESETWTVTLTDGVYTFQCDPHAAQMKGAFSVGSAQLPPPPPPPAAQPKCKVPKVVGKKLLPAKRAITRARCRVGRIRRAWSKSKARGMVVKQTPRAGVRRPRGTRVNLVVSRGRR